MNIALIGLGEVGRVLAEDLADGSTLSAWDTAFAEPVSRAAHNARELPVRVATGAADAVQSAELVISAVTAANDLSAARDVAPAIARGAWFVDLNSASPSQKQDAAALIEAAGGRYVEAAVLSPIGPLRIGSPILLGGPHASDFVDSARDLGFSGVEFFAPSVGPASATKLCRSVVVKGFEALLMESMLTARTWGVEKPVLDSLSNLLPAADWAALAEYMIRRSIEHGERRSEEMVEAASAVTNAGVEPLMATATARRQAWADKHRDALNADDLGGLLEEWPDELEVGAGDDAAAGSRRRSSRQARAKLAERSRQRPRQRCAHDLRGLNARARVTRDRHDLERVRDVLLLGADLVGSEEVQVAAQLGNEVQRAGPGSHLGRIGAGSCRSEREEPARHRRTTDDDRDHGDRHIGVAGRSVVLVVVREAVGPGQAEDPLDASRRDHRLANAGQERSREDRRQVDRLDHSAIRIEGEVWDLCRRVDRVTALLGDARQEARIDHPGVARASRRPGRSGWSTKTGAHHEGADEDGQ